VSKAFSETQQKKKTKKKEKFSKFHASHKNQDVAKLTVVVVSKDLPARRDDDDGRRRLWRFEYNE
jgi:hypothetical protein